MTPRPRAYREAFTFVRWLLQRLDAQQGTLARHSCEAALALLDDVVVALDDPAQVVLAMEATSRLGQRLRLAAELGLLSERQMLHGLQRLDDLRRSLQSREAPRLSA